jgi:hypothetical protein
MHVVTGNAVTPRKWEECGWTAPAPQPAGFEVVLDTPVEQFARLVMSQHYIVVYGDATAEIRDLCTLLGVEVLG